MGQRVPEKPVPSFKGRTSSSKRASTAARGSSKKVGTRPERRLRKALWAAGLRYRKNADYLPGKPDLVFIGRRVAVFCDGDFWHGFDWPNRKAKLGRGHNSAYWIAKIERNIARDQQCTKELREAGWVVLRFWESEILADAEGVVARIRKAVDVPR